MNNIVKLAFICILFMQHQWASAWGMTGHRVIAEIAENHLSKKARKNIKKIIGNQRLAYWSNWADFIKSDPDPDLNSTGSFHFLNTAANLDFQQFMSELSTSPDNNLYKSYVRIKEEANRKKPLLKRAKAEFVFYYTFAR